jgi:serine/threonine protein kinase
LKRIDINNIDATDKMTIANQITKIIDEAKILARLNHPNIIKYFDSYLHGNSYCIVTEFCEVCILLCLLFLNYFRL